MKIKHLALIGLIAAPLTSFATVTIGFGGGALFGTSVNDPLADGALVYAVTSLDATFDAPTSAGFVSGNDTLLGKWSVDSSVGAPGAFDASLAGIVLDASIVAGKSIAIYWFPSLTVASAAPTAGAAYGTFTDASWVIPADGSTVSFPFETVAIGGSLPDSAGVASLTIAGSVIPEPSTYAALAGVAVLGLAALRRRRA